MAVLFFYAGLAVMDPPAAGMEDSFSPTTEKEAEDLALGKSIIIRGAQHEIGTVAAIITLARAGSSAATARQARAEAESGGAFSLLHVGDRVLAGETVSTGPGVVMELLLGLNARLRLEPETRLRLAEMTAKKTRTGVITTRKLELLSGSVRARVRENPVTPSPVLFMIDNVEIAVGLERFAVKGGIEAVLRNEKTPPTRDISVYNGAVEIFRPAYLIRKAERIILSRGYRLVIPGPKAPAAPPLTLASPYFEAGEIEDWPRFIKELSACGAGGTADASLCGRVKANLWAALGEGLQEEILRVDSLLEKGSPALSGAEESGFHQRLLARLNWILEQGRLREKTRKKAEAAAGDKTSGNSPEARLTLPASELALRNRRLLEAAFPGVIKPLATDARRVAAAIEMLRKAAPFSTENWRKKAPPPPVQKEMLSGP